MKFKMFSVVVGTNACIAECPFCVSREKPSSENMTASQINTKNLITAANLANRSGVDTVMITSKGEPLLFPNQISEVLHHLKPFKFPFIELQTNCIPIMRNKDMFSKFLEEWYSLGLNTITVSVVSHKQEENKKNYFNNKKEHFDITEMVRFLHSFGYTVRLTCICCKGIMDSPESVEEFLEFAKSNNIEQTTLRPLNEEYARKSTHDWIESNKMSIEQKETIQSFLEKKGTKLLELERIGSIYDFRGQNVLFSMPLTRYTRDTNPENIRNLIYCSDGHIRYEWEKDGAILL